MSVLMFPMSLQQLGVQKDDLVIQPFVQYKMKEVNRWDIFMLHLWPRTGFLGMFDSTSDPNLPNNLCYSNEDTWEYPEFDNFKACNNTLFLYKIGGVTKDAGGSVLPNCEVTLFHSIDDSKLDQGFSDINGNFLLYSPFADTHYIVAYNNPNVTGATVNTLTGTPIP